MVRASQLAAAPTLASRGILTVHDWTGRLCRNIDEGAEFVTDPLRRADGLPRARNEKLTHETLEIRFRVVGLHCGHGAKSGEYAIAVWLGNH
jgi:hypothetical protein